MTYQDCLDYFYQQLPMFHRSGAAALKVDLHNIIALCKELGDPQDRFKSIHIAGTNGKGSSSHMLASILQSSGYKTGLYTSPHLKDFRERIRINGKTISKNQVVDFVEQHQTLLERIKPSFFELTVALAFDYFASQRVDIAVIEVGLGGRLDSTNIIHPELCLITSIGMDHSDLLGDTLEVIAREKAGIIKDQVPVVISERQSETEAVFTHTAMANQAEIFFAQDYFTIRSRPDSLEVLKAGKSVWSNLVLPLRGTFQQLNLIGVLQSIQVLNQKGYSISDINAKAGLENVVSQTGIRGRWETLSESPKVICDTGHNQAAMTYTLSEIAKIPKRELHMVLGFVNDKDISSMLELLPKEAKYYFCQANVPRSLPAAELAAKALTYGLQGEVVPDPNQALMKAKNSSAPDDLIFVGGSTFVVAELTELDQ